MKLRPRVREELAQHGIHPGPGDTPDQLKEQLHQLYLEEVRRIRDRRRHGELPGRDFARAVELLRDRYPLLAMPTALWAE